MKTKEIILSLALATSLWSCTNTDSPTLEQEAMNISFNVLQVEQLPMSRASLKDACTSLNYFRYTDGELTKSSSQSSSESAFGTFSDYLTWGEHELCFVGHNSSTISEDNGAASFDKVTDTFTYYISLNVNENTSKQQSFTLERRVAKFELLVLDEIPADLASMKIEISGAATSVDLRTGKGSAVVTQTKTVQIPASVIGTSENKFSAYLFLPNGVTEVDILATTYNSDGEELVQYEFEDVEVQTNYITRYKGRLFGTNPGFTLSVDDEWEDVNEFEF